MAKKMLALRSTLNQRKTMRDAVVPQLWTKGGTVPAGGLGVKFCHDLPPLNTSAGEVCVKGWGPSSFYLGEYTPMHPKEPNRQLSWDKTA